MKRLIVIGGAMGIGKTTVCRELQNRLPNCVFLDGDWCWDAKPFIVNESTKKMVLDNIAHLLNNFLTCEDYENVLFCWVLHRQEILDDLLARLHTEGARVYAISLICDADTLRGRVQSDISNGIRGSDAMERSLAYLPMYEGLRTKKVCVGETPNQTADEILKIVR